MSAHSPKFFDRVYGRTGVVTLFLVSSLGASAALTESQRAAFVGANSGAAAITESALTGFVQGVLVVVALCWLAWVALGAFQVWSHGHLSGVEAGSRVLRALWVTLITLAVVTLN